MTLLSSNPEEILKPVVAGRFYSADAEVLRKDIRGYLEEAGIEPTKEPVLAILSPHAGYMFSGPTAGYSYRFAQNQNPDTVLIIGLAHQGIEGACVFAGKAFRTPLGLVPVDKELTDALWSGNSPIFADSRPFLSEHSVEVNLPFIQTVFPHASVTALLITRDDPQLCRMAGHKIAQTLQGFTQKKVLIVVSSDLSHYPSYDTANQVDLEMLKSLETLDPTTIYKALHHLVEGGDSNLHCVMCGGAAMLTAVETARKMGNYKGRILHYSNSGDSSYGEHSRVVGYGSFAIYAPYDNDPFTDKETLPASFGISLGEEEKRTLLAMARSAIVAGLERKKYKPQPSSSALNIQCGLFVSLHNHGELRGCLGRFDAGGIPVCELVSLLAHEASQNDIRFSSVRREEVPDLDIQISLLEPLQRVNTIEEIEIGKHGLQIQGKNSMGRMCSGTLLPQVASERNWDIFTFLESTCVKAGLPPSAWQDEQTEIYKYGALVFGDLDFNAPPYERP